MSQKITSYEKVDYKWHERWKNACPVNAYKTASVAEIPLSGLPQTLIAKVPAVCMVNSGDLHTYTYLMVDFHREDKHLFDRQPFIVGFNHEEETAVAGFVHHLQNDGTRSSYNPLVTSGLLTVSDGSGLVQCQNFWLRQTEGTFEDLAVQMPQEQKAFHSSVSMLDRLKQA